MITHFKSALDQVKADEELISKTEIYLKDAMKNNENKNNFGKRGVKIMNIRKLAIAASMAIVLIGGSSGAYAYYQTPVKYLSLDINPSVELGVNAFDKVVQAEAYNEDGEVILEGVDVIGSDVTAAVSALVSSAADNGYVAEDGSTVISVTSETDDAEAAEEIETAAEAGVDEALDETGETADVIKDNVALERRDAARELGITPGKLNLINKLIAVDSTATVDQYKDASVKEIMKTIKANRKGTATTPDTTTDTTGTTTGTTDTTTGTAATTTTTGGTTETTGTAAGTAATATQALTNTTGEKVVESTKSNGNVDNSNKKDDTSKDKTNGNSAGKGNSGKSNGH